MRSSPAQNAFVASDKRVRLQCIVISYSEVSIVAETILSLAINAFVCSVIGGDEYNRDCLVASDKCVRLQCDIVFEGETSCI